MRKYFETERVFKWLPVVFLGCGIFLVYIQIQFDSGGIGFPGIALIGMAVLMYGIIEIFQYFITRPQDKKSSSMNESLNAGMVLLHSAALMMIGAALITFSLLFMAGWADEMLLYIRQRPGIVWLFFGVLGITFSLTSLFRSSRRQYKLISILASLPSLITLLLVLLIGLAACIFGLIEIIFPFHYQQIISLLTDRVNTWLF